MNYKKIYDSLINRGLNRKLPKETYKEKHHIIPKCLGGTNDDSNLVYLLPEEHYTCHLLLVKIYPHEHKLLFAARMMRANKTGQRNNKQYGWLKRKAAEAYSANYKHSPEIIEKMKANRLKNNPKKVKVIKPKKGSIECNLKISLALVGTTKHRTKAHNLKIGLGNKGKIVEEFECIYCKRKIKGTNNLNRWHNENCKENYEH